jgi:hypothetical protein
MMALLIATLILSQATRRGRYGYKDTVMSPSGQQKIAKYILQSRWTNHDEYLEIERLLGTRHRRTCDSPRTSPELGPVLEQLNGKCFKR